MLNEFVKQDAAEKAQNLNSKEPKKNLLALSVQPFVSFQHATSERALGEYYNIITVWPADPNFQQKDGWESLAKFIYERTFNNPEIKAFLPWL